MLIILAIQDNNSIIEKGVGDMQTEAMKRAKAKYAAKNVKQIKLNLNIKTDADILEQLEKIGNRQGYIKQLIREDIKRK